MWGFSSLQRGGGTLQDFPDDFSVLPSADMRSSKRQGGERWPTRVIAGPFRATSAFGRLLMGTSEDTTVGSWHTAKLCARHLGTTIGECEIQISDSVGQNPSG